MPASCPPPKTGFPQYSCALQIHNPCIFPDATQSIKSTHVRFNASSNAAAIALKISGIGAGSSPTASFLWLCPTGFSQLGQHCLPQFSLVHALPFLPGVSSPGPSLSKLIHDFSSLGSVLWPPCSSAFQCPSLSLPSGVSLRKSSYQGFFFAAFILPSQFSLHLLSILHQFTCLQLWLNWFLEPVACCNRPNLRLKASLYLLNSATQSISNKSTWNDFCSGHFSRGCV